MKRCTRLDLDSEMENFIKIGKDLGLEGDKLLQFAEKKEAEAIEREERNKERELRKLEIEAEKKRLEADAENKRLEAVEAEKRRAHELEMKRLELNVATPGTPQEPRSDQSARAPKLPAFNENTDKMDAYLERFERFAKNNKWQKDVWATRLSALLTGKSLEFYSRLSREEADDYRKLKLALLRHYDYTEEGYRRKFRGCKPEEGETPALFIERIKSYLEKWIETAGLQKEVPENWRLILGNKRTKACRPLQMRQNVTWRHTTRSSRIRHRELTSRRDQRKAQVEEAELRISRFVLLVGLKVTEQQGALFDNPLETAISKGKSIPAKRAPPHLNIRPRLL